MSTGAVVALAMDLCEAGVADYGLRFGDTGAYLEAPRLVATRQGFGAELALGARALAALKGGPTWPTRSRAWRCRPMTRGGPSAWGSATPPPTAGPATCALSRPATTSSAAPAVKARMWQAP